MTKYGALARLNPICRRNLNCPHLNRKSQKIAVVFQPSAGDEVERIILHQKDLQHLKMVQCLQLAHRTQLPYLSRLLRLKICHEMLRRTIKRSQNLKSHRLVNLLPRQLGHRDCRTSYLSLLPHPLQRSHNSSLSSRRRARLTGQRTKNEHLQKLPEKH